MKKALISLVIVFTLIILFSHGPRYTLPISKTVYIDVIRKGLESSPYRISDPETVKTIVKNIDLIHHRSGTIKWKTPEYRLYFITSKGRVEVGYVPGSYIVTSNRVYSVAEEFERLIKPEIDQAETYFWKYGIPYPWADSDRVFPLDTIANVVDFDTGKSFQVQFLDGDNHADCQTLSAEDTHIYKDIYGGAWSWKRRAVILQANGYRLAASMVGKPHGAGSIPDNELPGHFCVHFLGSRTHAGNSLDPEHQQMIMKAAGKRYYPPEEDKAKDSN